MAHALHMHRLISFYSRYAIAHRHSLTRRHTITNRRSVLACDSSYWSKDFGRSSRVCVCVLSHPNTRSLCEHNARWTVGMHWLAFGFYWNIIWVFNSIIPKVLSAIASYLSIPIGWLQSETQTHDALYSTYKCFPFLHSICTEAPSEGNIVSAIVIVPSVAASAATGYCSSSSRAGRCGGWLLYIIIVQSTLIITIVIMNIITVLMISICGCRRWSCANGHLLNVSATDHFYIRLRMNRR